MEKLKGLKPEKVFEFFEYISSVARGSGNTKAVSNLCVEFAKERGLDVYQDTLNNVIIHKPATPGYEGAPIVVIQGHLDMVCAKDDNCIKDMAVDVRSKLGIFLVMQYPLEIDGVSNQDFLRTAMSSHEGKKVGLYDFINRCEKASEELKMNKELIHRSLNVGFSGGEKKKNEVLQIKLLKPSFIILDELDSGLDVDSLKIVASNIAEYKKENPNTSILIITHLTNILEYIKPDYVHIMANGNIVKTGDYSLAKLIEKEGYESIIKSNEITGENNNE
jgi:Fe-S cluster assembly ATP-binding protein